MMRTTAAAVAEPRVTRPDTSRLLAVVLVLYGAAYLAFTASGLGSEEFRVAVNDFAFLPIGLAAVVLAIRAAVGAPSVRSRRAWLLLAGGFAAYVLGDLFWFVQEVLLAAEVPYPSIADVAYLSFYVFVMAGLIGLPRERPAHWAKAALDLGIVVTGTSVALWWLVLAPIAAEGASTPIEAAVALAYPVGDTLTLFALAAAFLARVQDTSRRALVLLGVGLLLNVVADLVYARLSLLGEYESGSWLDACYLLGWMALALAAQAQVRGADRALAGNKPLAPSRPIPVLPYVAVAAVFGLLFVASIGSGDVLVLVGGAILVTVLVVARQEVTARENARLLAERAAAVAALRFQSIVRNASEVIAVVDQVGRIVEVTPSVAAIDPTPPADLVGHDVASLVSPADAPLLAGIVTAAASRAGRSGPVEVRVTRPDQSSGVLEASVTNLLDDPLIRGLVVTLRDVTDRVLFAEQLRAKILTDPLTGLANRALLIDRADQALRRSRRRRTRPALLFLDIDNFKQVNDTLGHLAGDRVLVEVAQRIVEITRTEDSVARLGGDEFAVLVDDSVDADELGAMAERVLAALAAPIDVDGRSVRIGASIGVVRADHHDDALALLRDGDIAMYEAKHEGRGTWRTFEPAMYEATVDRAELDADLRTAVERGELRIAYQPLVSLETGEIVGVEALARWQHPTRGLLPPASFIPVAERTGEINRLGRWVLEEACREVGSRNAERGGQRPLRANVNVSVRQLDGAFADVVRDVLRSTGFPAGLLVLEITESALATENPHLPQILSELRSLGVRISIDDFGTGYSALGYLRDLPVDELKIDRVFVEALKESQGDALVSTILSLGRELALETVAEGIETPAQLEQLRALGCELGQGYLLGRPGSWPDAAVQAPGADPGTDVDQAGAA